MIVDNITARYDIESFTFYNVITKTHKKKKKEVVKEEEGDDNDDKTNDDNDSGRNTTTTTTTTEITMSDVVPAVTVDIQYATTSSGGSIVSSQHDTTGIFIWPATYLLCQYLILEYPNILILQQQQPFIHPHHPTTTTTNNATNTTHNPKCKNILELGCGCGMVSTVLMKYHIQQQQQQQQQPQSNNIIIHWYATDMDSNALELTYQNNHIQNHIPCSYTGSIHHYHYDNTTTTTKKTTTTTTTTSSLSNVDATGNNNNTTTTTSTTIIHSLTWGNTHEIRTILDQLQPPSSTITKSSSSFVSFDMIVAADIIYPSQNDAVLHALFDTVQSLLSENGIFILSYCHRDPTYTTIMKFIQAASDANFVITAPSSLSSSSSSSNIDPPHPIDNPTLRQNYLPPLLDAQILLLRRCATMTTTTTNTTNTDTTAAQIQNDLLGYDDCKIFPGLRTKLLNIQIQNDKLRQRQERRRKQQQQQQNLNRNDHDVDDINNGVVDDDNNDDDDDDDEWDAPPIYFND